MVSLKPSDSANISPSIYSTHFGVEDLILPISFDGFQLYEGIYDVSVENFNRFWVESGNSAQTSTGFVPSLPPIITDINISHNDTIAANLLSELNSLRKWIKNLFPNQSLFFPA